MMKVDKLTEKVDKKPYSVIFIVMIVKGEARCQTNIVYSASIRCGHLTDFERIKVMLNECERFCDELVLESRGNILRDEKTSGF